MKSSLLMFGVALLCCFFVGLLIGRKSFPQEVAGGQPLSSEVPAPLEASQKQALDSSRPVVWSRLESTNYWEFVERLREVGCPERTITDVIRSYITRSYAPKFAGIARSGNFVNPSYEARERLGKREEVNREIEVITYDRLGLERPVRSPGPLFTAEQEEKIAAAARQFPRAPAGTNLMLVARARSNQVERLAFLSQYLSEKEMTFYSLDREGQAPRVEQLLEGMQPTQDEFVAVARAIEGKDTRRINGSLPLQTIDAVQTALSADRFDLFQVLQRPEYRGIISFAKQHQLTSESVASLVRLRRTVFPQDTIAYREQVMAILSQPKVAARYLEDRVIHPVASQ